MKKRHGGVFCLFSGQKTLRVFLVGTAALSARWKMPGGGVDCLSKREGAAGEAPPSRKEETMKRRCTVPGRLRSRTRGRNRPCAEGERPFLHRTRPFSARKLRTPALSGGLGAVQGRFLPRTLGRDLAYQAISQYISVFSLTKEVIGKFH